MNNAYIMNQLSLKKFIPGIAWFFITLYLMCLPGKDLPEVGWLDKVFFDKWVHIGIFALLVFLFCMPFSSSGLTSKQKGNYFTRIALSFIVWGITIEFIQKFFIPGRSFDLLDWAADSTGVVIAYLFCRKKFTSEK